MKSAIKRLAVLLLAALLLCTGCKKETDLRLTVTWGMAKEDLFRVEGEVMTIPEARILLMTELAGYRNLYGEGVLLRQFGDQTLEDAIKENTLTLLGKIMVMDQMAGKYQIYLTDEETARTQEAAGEYLEGLSEAEKDTLGASAEEVQQLYERILLADRVFEELTSEQEIEVSDDEARVVTFRHIMTEKTEDAYSRILEAFDRLQQGADFDSIADIYNEDAQVEYSVGRGELDETLEEAVFSMETGEMSIVLESARGYHIILCVNNFDREATEVNKQNVLSQRKWEAFEETYNAFAESLNCEFNEKKWDTIEISGEDAVNSSFLDIYKEYFCS